MMIRKWFQRLKDILAALLPAEGVWHDQGPCQRCGMRVFYVVEQDGGLHVVCAACRELK